MKYYAFTLLFACLAFLGCRQKEKYPYETSDFRPALQYHLKNIVAVNQLTAYDSLTNNFLNDSCTKEELMHMINFSNPLVRIVAYRAIVKREEPDYFPILLNHLDDTAKVTWWYFNDAADDFMVSDLMIRQVIPEGKDKLTKLQKDSLIDAVLIRHNYLDMAQWMIEDLQPQEKYYSIVRLLAQRTRTSCHGLSNIYALSKFKKQEDIPFIQKNFSTYTDNNYCNVYYFKSIEVFPDTVFFPLLTMYFEEVIKKKKQEDFDNLQYYCRALVQYKNQSSLNILTALSKKETYPDTTCFSFNQQYIFLAIHKYPAPLYDALYNDLKPQMDDYIIKYLDRTHYNDETTW